MAAKKSTDARDLRPYSAGAYKKDARWRELVREKAMGRVEYREHEVAASGTRWARGLLSQLRENGWIPANIKVDEHKRVGVEWTDRDGGRCVLVPYGALQWHARRYPRDHKERMRQAFREQAQERRKRKAIREEHDHADREPREREQRALEQATAQRLEERCQAGAHSSQAERLFELADGSPARFRVGERAMLDDGEIVEISDSYGVIKVAGEGFRPGYGVRDASGEVFFRPAGKLWDADGKVRHLWLVSTATSPPSGGAGDLPRAA